MNDILEQLKKKKANLESSLIKVRNIVILEEHRLSKNKEILSTIEGRLAELTENIGLIENENKPNQ